MPPPNMEATLSAMTLDATYGPVGPAIWTLMPPPWPPASASSSMARFAAIQLLTMIASE